MTDHEAELQLLRTSVRRLWSVVLIMFCAFMSLAALSIRGGRVHADSVPSVLTAKQFVVVDDAGNQSIIIGSVPGLNSQKLSEGADFRGLVIFTSDHTPVASLGLGTPHPPAQGADGLHYSELFLQSEDGKSAQAVIRTFGPGMQSSTRLHFSNSFGGSTGILDAFATNGGTSFVGLTGFGSSIGGGPSTAQSSVVANFNGVVGLRNCPPPTGNCGPVH